MAIPIDAGNKLLTWLLTSSAVTRPTAVYAALHTGNPGTNCANNEVTTGTDAAYIRKAVTMGSPVNGGTENSTTVTYNVDSAASNYTVTHMSLWDAETGGNPLFYGQLVTARALEADDVFLFDLGDIFVGMISAIIL